VRRPLFPRIAAAVVAGAVAVGMVATGGGPPTAEAQSSPTLDGIRDRLSEVREERARIEERITEATVAYERLQTTLSDLEEERDELLRERAGLQLELDELDELVVFRIRETFKHGAALDPIAVFLGSDDPVVAFSKAETIQRVVSADQASSEDLVAVRTRVVAADARLAEQRDDYETAVAEQAEVGARLQAEFAALEALESELTAEQRAEVERLEAQRREREERARAEQQRREQQAAEREAAQREASRAARSAPSSASDTSSSDSSSSSSSSDGSSSDGSSSDGSSSDTSSSDSSSSSSSSDTSSSDGSSSSSSSDTSSSSTSPPAPASGGGKACPLDQPRSFIDSWGYARSGGRAHRGTDIMGPRGIPVRAITSGTWNIQRTGPSAGLWAILHGDNGDHYWYMHLDSHTVGSGARVSAGQQVGTNGSTGNATAGAEHVHFEVHPGGGSAINPYPLLRSVC
jgi:peptidoglycan LD-endopeptidase LytH